MDLLKKCAAELIGTAVLVFVGCGVAAITGADLVATSLAFGFVIVAMAYSIGNISGCHINPAVSFAMALTKKMSWKDFGFYVLSQCLGAFVGALFLGLCLRGDFSSLGGNAIQAGLASEVNVSLNGVSLTLDGWSYVSAFLAEVFLTFVFLMAILGVTDSKFHDGKHAGVVIGLALALVHFMGLGLTGTSVNPARSLAPAVLQAIAGNSTSLSQIWIWVLAPMAGAALAALAYSFLVSKKNAKAETTNEE